MAHPSGLFKLLTQGASVAATRVVVIGAALLGTVVVARALTVADRGRFGLLMATAAFAIQFGNLGLANANAYLVARQKDLSDQIVANTARFFVGIFLVLALVGILLRDHIPALSQLDGSLFWIALGVGGGGLMLLLVQNLLAGCAQFSIYNGVDIFAKVSTVGGMAVLWMVGATSTAWFGAIGALGSLVAAIVGLKLGGFRVSVKRWSSTLARQQVRMGGRAYVSNLAFYALARLPVFFIEARAGLDGLAFFSQALVVTEALLVLPGALGTVLFPNLAGMSEASDRIRTTLRLTLGVTVMMLLMTITTLFVGRWVFPLVYGAAYIASMPYLIAMLPGVVAQGVSSVTQNALSANGFPWTTTFGPIAGVAVVWLYLLFSHGALDCAWAYSAGSWAMLIVSFWGWWLCRLDRHGAGTGGLLSSVNGA